MADDERDIRSLHSKFDTFQNRLYDIHTAIGGLTQGQKNLNNYVKAVSANAKDNRNELDDHKDDETAHGIGAAKTAWASAARWISIAITIVAIAVAVITALYRVGMVRAG